MSMSSYKPIQRSTFHTEWLKLSIELCLTHVCLLLHAYIKQTCISRHLSCFTYRDTLMWNIYTLNFHKTNSHQNLPCTVYYWDQSIITWETLKWSWYSFSRCLKLSDGSSTVCIIIHVNSHEYKNSIKIEITFFRLITFTNKNLSA